MGTIKTLNNLLQAIILSKAMGNFEIKTDKEREREQLRSLPIFK